MANSFQKDNQEAYRLLLGIEVVLRELLRLEYEQKLGPRWQRQLPPELLKNIKASQTEESRPQFDYLRLGPLYYLNFGELLKLLQQKHAQGVCRQLGGEVFLKQLENLFTPRNAVCHSRPVSSVGLKAIETLHAQLETALTRTRFEFLLANPDVGLTQRDFAANVLPLLRNALSIAASLPRCLPSLEIVDKALLQFWWVDDALAGFNRMAIEEVAQNISDYNKLPSGVGASGERQRYLDKSNFQKAVAKTIAELEKIER
jgi:hypothetical protein